MFSEASKKIRENTYGFLATSTAKIGAKMEIKASSGTAFMVTSGYLITAAHSIHHDNDPNKQIHQNFECIRTPDIGQNMEKAIFIAEDIIHDIALLKIEAPKDSTSAKFVDEILPRGTNCGFLGFPLSNIDFSSDGKRSLTLSERFQGAYISNYFIADKNQPTERSFYEIDTLMYSGSSGCPAFTIDGKIIGMQVASVMQKRKDDNQTERIAISLAVPSVEILNFLKKQNINI